MFNPAHDALVMFLPEAGGVTESTDGGVSPAAFSVATPALPTTSAGILGYTDLPETSRGLNNSKGFAIGTQGAAYNKRGRREPSITVNIRPGNVAALDYLFPEDSEGSGRFVGIDPGRFFPLTIWVLVKNGYADCYRFCKPSSVQFSFSNGDAQGGEITIAVTFQAMAYSRIPGAPAFPASSVLRGLLNPMEWVDVRNVTLAAAVLSSGAALSHRKALMSLTVSLDMGLERKNERPSWGDDEPLSGTCYDILEHHKTVTGEMVLHERLAEELFSGGNTAQDWGDMVIGCSGTPRGVAKYFKLTLSGLFPTNETMQGGESSREIDFTVPFTANDILFELVDVAASA